MAIRKKIVVAGRVQGVFYRDTCRRVAEKEGVGGSAINAPDGKVEIHLEGESDAVERVIEWCREGPPLAHVSSVDVSDESPQGDTTFSIR